jgi:hypothetical protein
VSPIPSNFPTSNDVFAAPSAPSTTVLSSGGDSTRNHPQNHQDLGDAVVAVQANVPLLSHDHSGSGSRATNKLSQINTHQSPDTDSATSALHHTIGTSATQAAAGNHTHTYVPISSGNVSTLGGQIRVTNSANITTTETAFLTTPSVTLAANSIFTVLVNTPYAGSTTNDFFIIKVRENNVAGGVLTTCDLPLIYTGGFGPVPFTTAPTVITTTSVSRAYCVTVSRFSGSGSILFFQGSSIIISQISDNTLITTV